MNFYQLASPIGGFVGESLSHCLKACFVSPQMCTNKFCDNSQTTSPWPQIRHQTHTLQHVVSNANVYSPKHFKLSVCAIRGLNAAYLDYDAHRSHRVIRSIGLQYTHPRSPFKLGSYFYHIGYAILVISSCDSLFHHGGMQKSAYKLINNSRTPAKLIVGRGKYNSPSL